MRPLRILFQASLFMTLAAILSGASGTETPAPAAKLSAWDAVILGVVEGVTEYLPISSTGHLIIANQFLHLNGDTPLLDRNGQPLWHAPPSPKNPEGTPLTQKLAADTYIVVIQFGAIAAVAGLYWRQMQAMLWGLLGRNPAGRRLFTNLVIAFLPAAAIGFFAGKWIEQNLFSVGAVIAALAGGALLILYAEWYRGRRTAVTAAATDLAELTPRQALNIGLLQCVALWPGTSRSMMTIIGGYFAGLDPKRSAEFSFLLGFVTLSAATVYKSWKTGASMIAVFGWTEVLLGAVVAAITAAIAIRFLVGWLSRHGMAAFAYYRLLLAAGLAALYYL